MKRLMILLLLAVPAMAATFSTGDFARGNVAPAEYDKVICESQVPFGRVSPFAGDQLCCVNENDNRKCETGEEKILGECFQNGQLLCLWHGEKDFWWSWRYRSSPCDPIEVSILASDVYEPLLSQKESCRQENGYWCCQKNAFAPPEGNTQTTPSSTKLKITPPRKGPKSPAVTSPSPTGALLVLNEAKWRAMELGYFKYHAPEQRAFQFEQQRCRNGGDDVRIIDPKYGSMFKNTRNIHPGMRAFYLTKENVIPLISQC